MGWGDEYRFGFCELKIAHEAAKFFWKKVTHKDVSLSEEMRLWPSATMALPRWVCRNRRGLKAKPRRRLVFEVQVSKMSQRRRPCLGHEGGGNRVNSGGRLPEHS